MSRPSSHSLPVITVLANCGTDTDKARRALVTWIQRKQNKGRSTQHILVKLRELELKFIKDASLHPAFRAARAETDLPRSPDLPLPDFVKRETEAAARRLNRPSLLDLTSISNMSNPISPSPAGLSSVSPTSRVSPLSPNTSPHSPYSCGPEGKRNAAESAPTKHTYRSLPLSPLQPRRSMGSSIPLSHSLTVSTIPRSPRGETVLEHLPPSTKGGQETQRGRSQSQPLTGGRRVTPSNRLSAPAHPLPPLPSGAQPHQLPSMNSSIPAHVSPAASPMSPISPPPPVTPNTYQNVFVLRPPSALAPEESDVGVIERQYLPGHLRLPSKVTPSRETPVTRGDSPVQGCYSGQELDHTGTDPPFYHLPDIHSYVTHREIGSRLDQALRICGTSPVVRREVIKCLNSEPGYELPYWHARLSDCNLSEEAISFLLREMSSGAD